MKTLIAFLKLIRTVNLLIMLATMVLSYYCLNSAVTVENLFDLKFILLIAGTLFTAASGYIINDYYDVKLDQINKPEKVIVGQLIPRRWAMLFHSLFIFLAVLCGMMVNFHVGIAIIICASFLFLYSVSLKRMFLWGNLLIALLSASTILILWLFNKSMPIILAVSYSVFAFMSSLLREIIKDAEDMEGDADSQCHTLPIDLGIPKTKRVLKYLNDVFIMLLASYCIFIFESDIIPTSPSRIIYICYLILLVGIPLIALNFMITNSEGKKDFSRLSSMMKYIMLAGIMSMVLLLQI